jgi:hypothetical protein
MTPLPCILGSGVLLLATLAMVGCRSPSSSTSDINQPAGTASRPKRYVCPRASGSISVDGRLNDAAWSFAPWTDAFVDIEGSTKPMPRFRTRAKMIWNDEYLMIAAEMEEPHVWGSLTEHDAIVYHDNDFEIFIDPDGDRANYYEIEINTLGTIFDLLLVRTYIDGGPARHEWSASDMKYAVHVDGTLNDPSDTDRGWSVEFAIPWRTLAEFTNQSTPPGDGDVWRINFSRVQWQHRVVDGTYERIPDTAENNWVWSPQGEINMHLPEHWGYVTFVEGAATQR